MVDTNRLRGAIYTQYPSMAACADFLKWSRQRLSNIVQGNQIPDVNDVAALRDALHMTQADIFAIFFA